MNSKYMVMKFLLPVLGLFYLVCPYDLFPDLVIGWGWLDDLVILGLLWRYYKRRQRRYGSQDSYREGSRSSAEKTENTFSGKEKARAGFDPLNKNAVKDPLLVLGVGSDASLEEIKTAYRKLANQYHPDKVLHLGDEFRELAERRFKEIQNAYQELTSKSGAL